MLTCFFVLLQEMPGMGKKDFMAWAKVIAKYHNILLNVLQYCNATCSTSGCVLASSKVKRILL